MDDNRKILDKIGNEIISNLNAEVSDKEVLKKSTNAVYTAISKINPSIIGKINDNEGSWLKNNWRPILMFVFIIIIFNNYVMAPWVDIFFKMDPNPFRVNIPHDVWDILKIGIGTYIAGRSLETATKHWKRVQK